MRASKQREVEEDRESRDSQRPCAGCCVAQLVEHTLGPPRRWGPSRLQTNQQEVCGGREETKLPSIDSLCVGCLFSGSGHLGFLYLWFLAPTWKIGNYKTVPAWSQINLSSSKKKTCCLLTTGKARGQPQFDAKLWSSEGACKLAICEHGSLICRT